MVPCKTLCETVRVHGLPVNRYRAVQPPPGASPWTPARAPSTAHRSRVRASSSRRPSGVFLHEQREGRRASPSLAAMGWSPREGRVAAALGPTLSSLLASPTSFGPVLKPNLDPLRT